MWSVARYDLRLSSAEFYRLTPRQLDALIRRKENAERNTEFLFAQLSACVVNFAMAHPKKPVEPRDFMPSEWAKQQRVEKPKRSRKRQIIATEIRTTMLNWLKD